MTPVNNFRRVARLVYNFAMNEDPDALTQRLATQLLAKRQSACTAESCTGGLIAKTFTDLAGSSDWFERGFVTYSNAAKSEMLGVPAPVIDDYRCRQRGGRHRHGNWRIASQPG